MDRDRRRTPNSSQKKRSVRITEKNHNRPPENGWKGSKGKGTTSKASVTRADSTTLVSDANSGKEIAEAYENMVIHYVDDVNRSEGTGGNGKSVVVASKLKDSETLDDNSLDLDKESNQDKEEVSDSDTARDSVSSQGEEKVQGAPERASRKSSKMASLESEMKRLHGKAIKLQPKEVEKNNNKSAKSGCEPSGFSTENLSGGLMKSMELPAKPSSDSSEGTERNPAEEDKEVDVLDEAPNGTQSVGSEDERFDAEENGPHKNQADLEHQIQEMELRIEKLEEELREVAALEISLYSVVPEHGSSAPKVHTPARRLSRLYIHACKHWTQDRTGTIAKNTVSGLIMIARSCNNDVPRYIDFDISAYKKKAILN